MKNVSITVNGLEIVGFASNQYRFPIRKGVKGYQVTGLSGWKGSLSVFIQNIGSRDGTTVVDAKGMVHPLFEKDEITTDLYWDLMFIADPDMYYVCRRYESYRTKKNR